MKLYQLLATENEVGSGYKKIVAETQRVFKGEALFTGLVKEYTPDEEGGRPLEGEEKQVVTTVPDRLAWTHEKVEELLDHEVVRDCTNQVAVADLVVDGKVLASNLPSTFLMVLEKRLIELRAAYDAMPTLDMSKPWEEHKGVANQFKYGPVITHRTEKKTVPVILAPATEKHPAQVKEAVEDKHVGTFKTMNFSGAVTPTTKSMYMIRIDKLIAAAKKARQVANGVEAVDRTIGKEVVAYLQG